MAKDEFADVDLNFLARMALLGFLEEPERKIATLLESGQPIEWETRVALAKALRGSAKDNVPTLKLGGHGRMGFYRRFRNLRATIILGKTADSLSAQLGYNESVRLVAEQARPRRTVKTIERAVTLSRRLDQWLEECRRLGATEASDFALEIAFLYAVMTEQQPSDAIKPSLTLLAKIFAQFELQIIEAQGLRLPGKGL